MIDCEHVLDRAGFWGKNGCSTFSEFVIIRSKNASSASLNKQAKGTMSVGQKLDEKGALNPYNPHQPVPRTNRILSYVQSTLATMAINQNN